MPVPPRAKKNEKAAPQRVEEEVDKKTVAQVDKAKAKGQKLREVISPPPDEEDDDEIELDDIELGDIELDDLELEVEDRRSLRLLHPGVSEAPKSKEAAPVKEAAKGKQSPKVEDDVIVVLNGMNSSINSLREQVVKTVNPVSERVSSLEGDVKDLTAELKTVQVQMQELLSKIVSVHQSHSEVSAQVLTELAKLNYGQAKSPTPAKKEEVKEPPRAKTSEEVLEMHNLNSSVLRMVLKHSSSKVGQPAVAWCKAFSAKLKSQGNPELNRLTPEILLDLLQSSGSVDGKGNITESES